MASESAAVRTQMGALKRHFLFELLIIMFYSVSFIFAVAIFRENFIVLFIFNPMFYAFSSGQRQPFATKIGDFFNDTDTADCTQTREERNVSVRNNRRSRSESLSAVDEGNLLVQGRQNNALARNEVSGVRKMLPRGFSFKQFCRAFKKTFGSELVTNALMLIFAALFVYFVDIYGGLITQFTHLSESTTSQDKNDAIMLYASLFIVVSCMALDPSLIICRLLNYYETNLLFNKSSTGSKVDLNVKENPYGAKKLMGKLNSLVRRVCYLYDACILTRSGHKNVFLDQVENIFIGSVDVIQTDDVPATFERLRKTGCRFWLMSDCDERSVMEIVRYSGLLATSTKVKLVMVDGNRPSEFQVRLQDYAKAGERSGSTELCNSSAIVLDAETFLKLGESRKCMKKAMQWISGCKAFIGCRLNAEQRADILEKVGNRLTPEALTLAIGCQKEDCLMMKKAHISVGVQKQFNNDLDADYVVNEFRTVSRLLLLHGMSSQRRMFQMRCFILLESAALRTVQFIWVLSSYVPQLMSSIGIFGTATIYYVNWLTIAWDVLFWFAAFIIYGPLYKYRGPKQKQRRPRELVTRISHTRLYINASLKCLMTFLGVALGAVIFSFTVKTFEHANAIGEALKNETLPIPDHTFLTIDYLACTNLMIVLCLILLMETREWSCLCALIPIAGYAVYWFFESLSGITVTLPNGLEQTSAAISLLKLNFNYWSYSRITFGEVLLPLELGIISLIMAMICLFLRCIFRQLRRKKYYNTHYSRRLVVGERESEFTTRLSSLNYFCSYRLYPKVYHVYSAIKTFGYFTWHLVKIYFQCKIRTALCIIAVLQLMVFENFWYIIGSIFGLTIPFLVSLYDLIKKKCSPGRAVRRSYLILDRKRKVWEERGSKRIKAGDIIYLNDGDMVPTDAILLSSSDKEKKCTYDQSFINGMTKANYSHALKQTETLQTAEELCHLELDIKLQDPWKQDASRFEAAITLKFMGDESVPRCEAIMTSEINWLLGGYRVKGTEWAICLVVYDGLESKVNLDAKMYKKFIKKMPVHEFQYLGRFLLGLFTFFLFLLLIYSFIRLSVHHISSEIDSHGEGDGNPTAVTLDKSAKTLFGLLDAKQLSVLSYLLGLVKIIPTPLLAILSLIRLFETELEINRDKSMNSSSETSIKNLVLDKSCFSRATSRILGLVPQTWKSWLSETLFLKIPTRVKTNSLNAFLGRVENVFIEKSGVLSKNHGNEYITLKRCSTHGKMYDITNGEINLDYPPEGIDELFTVLALAKDAYPSAGVNQRDYSSQFEVEKALAEEVTQLGYVVSLSGIGLGHPNSTYTVASDLEHKITVAAKGKSKLFRFLYRLSIPKVSCFIVRDLSNISQEHPNERALKNRLYALGALGDMKSLLQTNILEQTEEETSGWAKQGLSALCLAWRDLSLEEFRSLMKDVETNNQIEERAVKEFLAESLHLLGSIAFDDARGMIRMLYEAKCRITVLTGDNLDFQGIENFCRYFFPCDFRLQHFHLEHGTSIQEDGTHQITASDDSNVICLNGEVWEKIFYRVDARNKLGDTLKDYTWFIGYNLKPYHKKEIIDLICKNVTPGKISMAIGNGLSDLPMLRRAHIGVVVRGERPGEDVKAQGDYVIGEFRFLKQLLHHGVLGKRNSFKFENVLWYEMLMFNMMPFVWYTMATLIDGSHTSNLPFGESYTLPFLSALAIFYAIIIYWNKRAADEDSYINDADFSKEYLQSREQGRSNTLALLVLTGVGQCLTVKLLTLWLFYTWQPPAITEGELRTSANQNESLGNYNAWPQGLESPGYFAFLSFLEVTYHTCIQSALVSCLLRGKRRFFAIVPLFGWICYLIINSKLIRKQPFIPVELNFSTFIGRFLLEFILISILHGIAIYGYRILAQRGQKNNSRSPKDVFLSDIACAKDCLLSVPMKVQKHLKRDGLARSDRVNSL